MENPFYDFFADFRAKEAAKRQQEYEDLYETVAPYGSVALQKYDITPMVVEVLEQLRDARYPRCFVPLRFFLPRPAGVGDTQFVKTYDWTIRYEDHNTDEVKVVVNLLFDDFYQAVGFAISKPYSSRLVKTGLNRESLINGLKELHTIPQRMRIYKEYLKPVMDTLSDFLKAIKNPKYECRIMAMGIPASEDNFSDIPGLPEHVGDWQILRKQISSTLFSQKEDSFQEIGFVRMVVDQQFNPTCFDVYLNNKKTRSGLSTDDLFQALMSLHNHPRKWGESLDETKSILYQMEARSRR